MEGRSNPSTPDPGFVVRVLEAVKRVSVDYGIPTAKLKPCIAYHLDGEAGDVPRDTAFTLAAEMRGLGLSETEAESRLQQWAARVAFRRRDLYRAVKSAFTRTSGEFRYPPPGLRNKRGGTYDRTLTWICREVGCPANCPAHASKYAGDHSQTFTLFLKLGWAKALKTRRWNRAVDVYSAIARREKQLGLAPGTKLFTSYQQLADLADGTNPKTVGDALKQLASVSLIEFTPGSGSGPHARDRVGSQVRRIVPIPPVPPSLHRSHNPALTTDSQTPPHIDGATPRGET